MTAQKPTSTLPNSKIKIGPKVGLIGYGVFGQFICQWLSKKLDILVYDKSFEKLPKSDLTELNIQTKANLTLDLDLVLDQEYIILAIPVQFLENFLDQNASKINPESLIIDVCSVKSYPINLLQKCLPEEQKILATHPLFGPHSGSKSLQGLKIVLCPIKIKDKEFIKIQNFLKHLGLICIIESAQEHDKQMAYVQALTFMIGKALNQIQIPDSYLSTPTYQHLLYLKKVVGGDSHELFKTIQNFNPEAQTIRKQFIESLNLIQKELEIDSK